MPRKIDGAGGRQGGSKVDIFYGSFIVIGMKKKNLITFGTGILILIYIVYTLEPHEVLNALLSARPEYFLLAGLFYFLNDVVAALSLKIITSPKISLPELIISHMCGMFYSNATPGRIGYYYTAFSISKKTETSRSGNIGILTLFQGINFLIKVFLCIMALIYFSSFIVDTESRVYLLLVSLSPILGVFLIVLALYTNILNKILIKIPILRNSIRYITPMQDAVRGVDKEKILKLVILSLFGWIFMSAQWFFLAISMDLENFIYLTALMLQPLLTTIMFVPISPSGLGLAEGGSALLFKVVGLTPANGVAFMLLVRINSIFIDFFGIIDMKIHGKG
ncbi:MAG: hypothetical protein DRO62_00485 [Candidatus Altiarchaeales archaeon]|nr:MAG: hypothetical protein DRO62_00485 [Candidatus Altiarchaeales archaeon]